MAEDVFFPLRLHPAGHVGMNTAETTDSSRHILRTTLRQARREIPANQRIAAAERLATQLLSLPFAPDTGYAAGYWAMDGEISLHAWQLRLPVDVHYCLPVLHQDGRLRFARFSPGAPLKTNRFGIPEPDVPTSALLPAEAMALVVLPLIGFDGNGNRLGMGGGWYDRSFAFRQSCPAPPWLVGAGFALQQVAAGLTPEPWDVRLDAVCCETGHWMVK